VLWRSDLAHSNAQPLYGKRAHKQRFRAVSYVCMLPASHTKEPIYKKKVEGWRLRKTTSHWPNLETCFRERPRERARIAAFTAAATSPVANSDGPIESSNDGNVGSSGGNSSSSTGSSDSPPRPPPELLTLRQRQLHGIERYPGSSSAPESKNKGTSKRRKKAVGGSKSNNDSSYEASGGLSKVPPSTGSSVEEAATGSN